MTLGASLFLRLLGWVIAEIHTFHFPKAVWRVSFGNGSERATQDLENPTIKKALKQTLQKNNSKKLPEPETKKKNIPEKKTYLRKKP